MAVAQVTSPGDTLPIPLTSSQKVGVLFVMVLAYWLAGLAGLALQSPQTGVTPVWPASGVAFAIAYRYGAGFLLGIVPAMFLIALGAGVPPVSALIAAAGSMLEAYVPLYLLRRYGVHDLRDLHSALLFVAGAVVGPVFSATIGSTAMWLSAPMQMEYWVVWLLWWLGNCVGFLVFGGLGLAVSREPITVQPVMLIRLAFVSLSVALLSWVSLRYLSGTASSLVHYLLIPLVVFVAIRDGVFSVFLVGVVAMSSLMFGAYVLPAEIGSSTEQGILYLDVGLVLLVTFTGLMVAAAWHERATGAQYAWQATHDSLTELVNRPEFLQRLQRTLQRFRRSGGEYVLMQIDLDNFKQVNDSFGHAAGDQVLRKVARVLAGEVRGRDTVARIGGDEFLILLEGCSIKAGALIAENIRAALDRLCLDRLPGQLEVSASVGMISLLPEDSLVEDALKRADVACYRAKHAGRNHVWMDPMGVEDIGESA